MDTDIVQGRKDLIAKCNDDSNHKSTRVDKTSPNSIGKIRKSHLTADKHYASRQAGYYLKLRRDWFSVLAIVIGLFAVGIMVNKNLVMSVASGAVALTLSPSLYTREPDMFIFNAMATSLFGGVMRAMKVTGSKPSSNGKLLVCFILGVNALTWAPSSSALAYVSPVPVSSAINEPRDVALSDVALHSQLVVPVLLASTITVSWLKYNIFNCKAIFTLALTMVIGTIMWIAQVIRPNVSGLLAVFTTIVGFLLRQLVAGAELLYSSVFPRFKLHVLFGKYL